MSTSTTTSTRRTRRGVRLGLAALGATVAGLTMTGGTAGASTPSPYPGLDRPTVTTVYQDTLVDPYVASLGRSFGAPAPLVQQVRFCVRDLNGTPTVVPLRLCP